MMAKRKSPVSEILGATIAGFVRQAEANLRRDRELIRLLRERTPVTQRICHVCGSDNFGVSADHMDHTLMEENQHCGACDYNYSFCTGSHGETIGRWICHWSYTETLEQSVPRIASREVATLIRRFELGLIATSIKPFVQALSSNPAECTTAHVLADWIDEHPDEFTDLSGYKSLPATLRNYTKPVGFPQKYVLDSIDEITFKAHRQGEFS